MADLTAMPVKATIIPVIPPPSAPPALPVPSPHPAPRFLRAADAAPRLCVSPAPSCDDVV
ncbi:hypothetical protein ACWY4P_37725 [Streptomyces sp. LZ34]